MGKCKQGMETTKESEVKKRLKEFMASVGMSANKFCITAGIDTTTFSRMTQDVNAATLTAIAKTFPKLDVRYILTGEPSTHESPQTELPLIPFDAVAGHLKETFEDSYPETIAVPKAVTRGADFVIRVDGDSMTPRFQSGELLLVKKVDDPSFFQWGKIYVLATSQGCVVKRLYPDRDDDNSVVCHSDNTASYPDYTVRKNSIYGVGLVVGHIGHD